MSHRTNDRRSGSGRDERRRDDDRRGRDREESRPRGNQQRQSGGEFSRPNNGQEQRQSSGGHGHQNYGGSSGRGGGPIFSGQSFTEQELMTDMPKKKFTGRCRLFVGNLPNEVKDNELKELFTPHGDIAECYLSGKGFAFLRLDTRAHAESAKEAIDGRTIHNRQVRVRFAVHGAALRVKELSPTVSNEMLFLAFSKFGEVERAVHIVDEKGRPTGEGIIEFERKNSCNEAIQAIREKVFLMTASPKPLIVEALEPRDEDDGLAERMIPRTQALIKEREMGPRFPAPNSFEFVYGMKWKELYEMERQRKIQLEEELREARRRLEADMELAYQDYQAQMLREDLQRRQQELERLEAARRERMGAMRPPGGQSGGPMNGPGGYQASFGPSSGMGMNAPPLMGGGPMANPFAGGPPPNMYGGGGPGGPGGPGGLGGPPGGHGGAPPQSQQQQQQGGQRQQSSANIMDGVNRLLQIFKNEPVQGSGRAPPHFGAGAGGPGMYQGGGPPPGAFNDFPPEKKLRR